MTSTDKGVGHNRFQRMIENFNDRPLEEITKHLDRLGISTAFIAGAAAVAKYSDKVLPACPVAAKIVAVILVFVSHCLGWLRGLGRVSKDGIWPSERPSWWFAIFACVRPGRCWRNVCSHIRLTNASSGTVQKRASPACGQPLKLYVTW
tara:strand:- start:360 stop:806 length:447 start_codon:yes stop_codon:yes gene_type:complete